MMESFSWFRSMRILKNFNSNFLFIIVFMNIVKFRKIMIEEIWEHLIIKFKQNFANLIFSMSFNFKTFSFEWSKFVGYWDGQNKIALKILF